MAKNVHLLDEFNLLSSAEGQTSGDAERLSIGIDQNAASSNIQEYLSKSSRFNKLQISNINNIRYEIQTKSHYSLYFSKVTDLIAQIESDNYKASYTLNAAGFLTSVFFASDYMVENTKRLIIDATYGTNK